MEQRMAEQKRDWVEDGGFVRVWTSDRTLPLEALAGADLTGLNLAGIPLSADDKETDLSGTVLRHADLSNAVLTNARGLAVGQLGGAVLRGAKLPEEVDLDK